MRWRRLRNSLSSVQNESLYRNMTVVIYSLRHYNIAVTKIWPLKYSCYGRWNIAITNMMHVHYLNPKSLSPLLARMVTPHWSHHVFGNWEFKFFFAKVSCILWCIWLARDKAVFESVFSSAIQVITHVNLLSQSIIQAFTSLKPSSLSPPRTHSNVAPSLNARSP